MLDIILLLLGLFIWWFYYGIECHLNGTSNCGGPYGLGLPFVCWVEELGWNIPFWGKRLRLKFTAGDEDRAKQLPGMTHFIIVCIIMPILPWFIYMISR